MFEMWRYRPKMERKNSDFGNRSQAGKKSQRGDSLWSLIWSQPSGALLSDSTSPCSKVSDTTSHGGLNNEH